METTYSLVSAVVESLELRQQLHVAQMKLGAQDPGRSCATRARDARNAAAANAHDDLAEMHTNYDILSNQLLVEQVRTCRDA